MIRFGSRKMEGNNGSGGKMGEKWREDSSAIQKLVI